MCPPTNSHRPRALSVSYLPHWLVVLGLLLLLDLGLILLVRWIWL